MIREARIATFLARAKEAEDMATKVKDDQARESWVKVAEGYRNLARLAELEKS
jgi:hypothetical protein